ncbi:M50 family peptidase [Staphylococcus pseudintermedius]|nr:M50 family peptidase [Staphylococcus pseudintermedius]EGQ4227586.1 M50 family peptidase [Staphylococcus pseudintermedius]EJD5727555.1 M50 family metallopeptidase [Staphylococcus pseudintermedius]EJO7163527.1 M50 family metallopeptidase [Staphylococcus pseudintermedius]MDK4122364.1 M50 family metallopeptidase [Staphylococcus pseudintermedius]
MHGYSWITSPIPISFILLLCIAGLYLVSRHYAYRPIFSLLDIALNYIPVLTHEFGHVLFNRLSGGRVRDFVVVTTRRERNATGQQGYAVTASRSRSGHIITTLGGYLMSPIMLILGLYIQSKRQGALFIMLYILVFIYFTWKTSRKAVPLLIIAFLILIGYLGIQSENLTNYSFIYMLVYHFILGTLLGEIIQSTITIVQLTFARPQPEWDGTALKMLTKLPTVFFSSLWIVTNFLAIYYFIQYVLL